MRKGALRIARQALQTQGLKPLRWGALVCGGSATGAGPWWALRVRVEDREGGRRTVYVRCLPGGRLVVD